MPIKPKGKPGLYTIAKGEKKERWSSTNEQRYFTNRWRNIRAAHLKVNPLCVECLKQDRTTLASILDHTLAVSLGGDFWDTNNHQGLCKSCHNAKSASERFARA